MPLTLDLLHEEHAQLQQSKRDPLKLGLYALGGVAALFLAYYGYRAISVGNVHSLLVTRQTEWRKAQPQSVAAEKEEKEINEKLAAAAAVSRRVENRFYWAPVLDLLFKSVTNNVQLVSLNGNNDLKDDKVKVVLEGMAAGAEPRGAAEQFRIALADHLGRGYPGATATFRSLEESSTSVKLDGKSVPTARFTIDLDLKKPAAAAPATPPPATERRRS